MNNFNLILSPFETIQENLSLEQFFLRDDDDFIILYKNKKSIVLGRNQVCYSEIFLKEQHINNIPFFRRYSGGGAVYLDNGTLNYAFITNYNFDKSSYSYFNSLIIKILSELGFENLVEKGCNIYYKNLKISGTAQYKRKNRFIHHGTLLVDTNLPLLESLLLQTGSYKTKAKRSEPAKTENLINILPTFTLDEFEKSFSYTLKEMYCKSLYALTYDVFEYVGQQRTFLEDKIWIYGSSPDYEFSNVIHLPDGDKLEVFLEVKKGKVISQSISKKTPLSDVSFVGCFHSFEDFSPIIFHAIGQITSMTQVNKICYQFFNSEKRA
jgi:lipoate---protein ligase